MLTLLAASDFPVDLQTVIFIVIAIAGAIGGLFKSKKKDQEAGRPVPSSVPPQQRTSQRPVDRRPRWSGEDDEEAIEAQLDDDEEPVRPAPPVRQVPPVRPVPPIPTVSQPHAKWPPRPTPFPPPARPAPARPPVSAAPARSTYAVASARPAAASEVGGLASPVTSFLPPGAAPAHGALTPVATAVGKMLHDRTQLQAAFVLSEVLGQPLSLRDEQLR